MERRPGMPPRPRPPRLRRGMFAAGRVGCQSIFVFHGTAALDRPGHRLEPAGLPCLPVAPVVSQPVPPGLFPPSHSAFSILKSAFQSPPTPARIAPADGGARFHPRPGVSCSPGWGWNPTPRTSGQQPNEGRPSLNGAEAALSRRSPLQFLLVGEGGPVPP